ncbi:MAG: glycosyltransferase family 2 protein [Gemmatimonadota bacterium]
MPSPDIERSPRPAVCVVNYNGATYLPRTLGRILELRDQFDTVLLVDDASTDASVEVARQHLTDDGVIVLPKNAGPGGARNAGFVALKADRVLFLDNDVFLGSDTVRILSEALDEAPKAVMALPRIVSDDEPDTVEYEGGEAHFSGLVTLRGAGKSRSGSPAGPPVRVGSMIACCFLFDRRRWGQEPLFDPLFPMYLEDHEFGLRTNLMGHDVLTVSAAECGHGKGTPGISIRATGGHTAIRVRQTILNRWQLMAKLYQGRTFLLMAPTFLLFEISQFLGCLVLGWGGHWMWAAGTFVRRTPELLKRRKGFRASRARSDTEVLTSGPHPLNAALARRPFARLAFAVLDRLGHVNWRLATFALARSRRS